jgi:hypothetical protein
MSRVVVSTPGFPFAHQPYRSARGLSFMAESLFFLKVFGLSSMAMGGAMLLSAASAHGTRPTDVRFGAGVLESSDDPYLKVFAAGPGCDWYVPLDGTGNVRSSDGQRNAPLEDRAGD